MALNFISLYRMWVLGRNTVSTDGTAPTFTGLINIVSVKRWNEKVRNPFPFVFRGQEPSWSQENNEHTRLHSSRMHTARLLTVSPSMHCVGGVCFRGVSGSRGSGLSLALVHSSTNMLKSVCSSDFWKPLIHTNMSKFFENTAKRKKPMTFLTRFKILKRPIKLQLI